MLDLKDPEGLRASRALIGTADVVLHNLPPDRARRFELDRESVREVNPAAVWCCVSALGSDGPEAELTAFDLVAQALSGLLVANAHASDPVPQRAGGIAMADFTAGLLAAIAALAGLVGSRATAPGVSRSPCLAPRSRSRRSGSSRVETTRPGGACRPGRRRSPAATTSVATHLTPDGRRTSSSPTTAATPPLMGSSCSPA